METSQQAKGSKSPDCRLGTMQSTVSISQDYHQYVCVPCFWHQLCQAGGVTTLSWLLKSI